MENKDTMKVNTFRSLDVDAKGEWAVFQGAGVTSIQNILNATTAGVPVLDENAPYYSPGFVGGSSTQIIHARWSDANFTTFEIADIQSGVAFDVERIPRGRYHSPALSGGPGRLRHIAFVKTASSTLTGSVVAKTRPGLYMADVILPDLSGGNAVASNMRFIGALVPGVVDRIRLRFVEGRDQLLVQESERVYTIDFSPDSQAMVAYPQQLLVAGEMTSEIAVPSADSQLVSFTEFKHVYLASIDKLEPDEKLWARPGNATKGLARLSVNGAHDVAWSGDGKIVFWFSGMLQARLPCPVS